MASRNHSVLRTFQLSASNLTHARVILPPVSNMPALDHTATTTRLASLGAILPGLFLAVLTLLFGFGMGVVFGLNEDAIKSRLSASAETVMASAYNNDPVAAKAVTDKSWSYMQRAHLHAGSLGVVAIALSLVLVHLGTGRRVAAALSVALGAGGLGYSLFWAWAGFRAPGLGSTGVAKESLAWLAIPSSGAVVAATVVTLVLIGRGWLRRGESA